MTDRSGRMDQNIVDSLVKISGEDWVDTDPARVMRYSLDSTCDSYRMVSPRPVEGSVVVKPEGAEEISRILRFANEQKIPVIARGAGTGLSAGAIPTEPSILIAMERMNRILEIDEENLIVTCEAAVTLGDLIEAMRRNEHLFFPLHPGDEGAQVGGMVAMNAGGVRAVRHGVMRNQVRGLEVVLPTGEIVKMGGLEGKLIKNNAGYDLLQLMIGSEGTLGIITKAALRLYPEPKITATLIISFNDRKDAFKTVPKILQRGVTPLALEFVGRAEITRSAEDLNRSWPAGGGTCYLLVILSETSEEDLFNAGEVIETTAVEHGATETLIAQTLAEQRDILEIRSHFLPAVQDELVDSPDLSVPRSRLAEYIDGLDRLEKKYHTSIPVSAHAGDGNLHLLIMKENGETPAYYNELKKEAYQLAVDLGGSITGEHGIGLLRRDMMPVMFSERELRIMWGIKKTFDPNNILNPGKMVIPFE
jgi:glycolate oxidase